MADWDCRTRPVDLTWRDGPGVLRGTPARRSVQVWGQPLAAQPLECACHQFACFFHIGIVDIEVCDKAN